MGIVYTQDKHLPVVHFNTVPELLLPILFCKSERYYWLCTIIAKLIHMQYLFISNTVRLYVFGVDTRLYSNFGYLHLTARMIVVRS